MKLHKCEQGGERRRRRKQEEEEEKPIIAEYCLGEVWVEEVGLTLYRYSENGEKHEKKKCGKKLQYYNSKRMRGLVVAIFAAASAFSAVSSTSFIFVAASSAVSLALFAAFLALRMSDRAVSLATL
eukprot:CAMPEP_0113889044 /NCGR_PEP_ID=MMETSP0780_2-20120614/13242_1 /TAXON_ID=652834 /ORGANISM="Palpitomonas bilix" /LENGTH=125 /DNA_ID=CAMNT_0000878027 /DNA_START=229 /DNA_END=603 /DNA_ORIENTATION=+ /assembly_acc=CAM_ASM_000599